MSTRVTNTAKFHMLIKSGLFLSCLTFSSSALSIVAASIYPSDGQDTLSTFTDPSYLNINPTLSPVNHPDGYSHVNSVEVDRNTGAIKGYAGYNNNTAGTIVRTPNLIDTLAGSTMERLVANTTGSIIYDSILSGPTQVTNTTATVMIEVEGSFNYITGSPALALGGAVSVNVQPNSNPFAGTSYVYGGLFSNIDENTAIPNAGHVFTDDTLQVFDGTGNVILNPSIPGLTSTTSFLDTDPSSLHMIINLTVPINNGDQLIFGGTAFGGATHAFLEDFRNLAVGDTGNIDAAEGNVDFLNTALIGIELPAGFTLIGADAPPASIVNTSAVPLPLSIWLFGSAIAVLGGFKRKHH